MRFWSLLLLLTACSAPLADVRRSGIGPPASGWTSPSARSACAPPDVAPRLHFAHVSHMTWMAAPERAELVRADLSRTDLSRTDLSRTDLSRTDLDRADLGRTRAAEAQRLDRMGLDGALRRIAPLALEATGHARMAEQLRGLPPIRERADVRRSLEVVRVLGDQLGGRTPERRVMIVLERGLREAMTSGFPDLRCAEIAGHGTTEAAVAAAAVEAGAPRERVTEASIELLEEMASAARVG